MHGPIDSQIVFLVTQDLRATSAFYGQVLGLPLALDQRRCRIYKVTERAFLGFCEKDEASPVAGVIVTLVTQDVDGWYKELRAHGVQVEKEPTYNPDYRIYHCFLRDPNGYLVEIQRFEDPRWECG
jgi:catechol 2,3-dioxygenase-like lactoylglutathione lyase family enzyme